MNRSAVALAADSAVSIPHGKGYKIYNTHKLFNLCTSSPVGIMVYENADLMSVPWETIIKEYRRQLGAKSFDTLEDYNTDFISYLDGNAWLFPESVQNEYAIATTDSHLRDLRSRIDNDIKLRTIKRLKISESQIVTVLRTHINSAYRVLKGQPPLPSNIPTRDAEVAIKYGKEIDDKITDIFRGLPLSDSFKKKLRSIAIWVLTKDIADLNVDQNYSGVVIAGFGTNDLYPSVITSRVESVVLNRLRYLPIPQESDRMTATRRATVVPFAQREMVDSFMAGIDPRFHAKIVNELIQTFDIYPTEIIKQLPGLTKKRRDDLLAELKTLGGELAKAFNTMIEDYRRTQHIVPIVRAVSVLPKEELASMAEALVSLTSTKRRVTLDAETVGGPIDVAVISKGDGFVWIKRKHYFEANENPQFLAKYRR
jgi:hypothetical protein